MGTSNPAGETQITLFTDSHANRIAKAVAVVRAEYGETLPVEHLAEAAGMSISSFHQHFRAVTSLSQSYPRRVRSRFQNAQISGGPERLKLI